MGHSLPCPSRRPPTPTNPKSSPPNKDPIEGYFPINVSETDFSSKASIRKLANEITNQILARVPDEELTKEDIENDVDVAKKNPDIWEKREQNAADRVEVGFLTVEQAIIDVITKELYSRTTNKKAKFARTMFAGKRIRKEQEIKLRRKRTADRREQAGGRKWEDPGKKLVEKTLDQF